MKTSLLCYLETNNSIGNNTIGNNTTSNNHPLAPCSTLHGTDAPHRCYPTHLPIHPHLHQQQQPLIIISSSNPSSSSSSSAAEKHNLLLLFIAWRPVGWTAHPYLPNYPPAAYAMTSLSPTAAEIASSTVLPSVAAVPLYYQVP